MAAEEQKDISFVTKAKIFVKFAQCDKQHNRTVCQEDACQILNEEWGIPVEKSKKLFQLHVKRADGTLSYDEFIGFYLSVKNKLDRLEQKFKEYDTNNDGTLSPEEGRAALESSGFSGEEIQALMETYGVQADGRLNYQEFVAVWSADVE